MLLLLWGRVFRGQVRGFAAPPRELSPPPRSRSPPPPPPPCVCREAVQELNTSVPVAASSADLSDEFLAQFQVVVLTDTPLAEAVRTDEFCHAHGIALIKVRCDGGGHSRGEGALR